MDDGALVLALKDFKTCVEPKAADPIWHPSEESVRECLAAALMKKLQLPADGLVFERLSGTRRTDLWVQRPDLAVELKFHRPIQSGRTRPLTQQFGDLLADCSKLATASVSDRMLVLVTDKAGLTHLTNKGLLPLLTTAPPKTLVEADIESLPATAARVAMYPGRWPALSAQLVWRHEGIEQSFLAWRIRPEVPVDG